jgi:hypothetical protein
VLLAADAALLAAAAPSGANDGSMNLFSSAIEEHHSSESITAQQDPFSSPSGSLSYDPTSQLDDIFAGIAPDEIVTKDVSAEVSQDGSDLTGVGAKAAADTDENRGPDRTGSEGNSVTEIDSLVSENGDPETTSIETENASTEVTQIGVSHSDSSE